MADRHPAQKSLGPLLVPISKVYGLAMRTRRKMYECGKLKTLPTPRPCICVGNISWGGTGKTPVTDWLLSWAEKRGLYAAVLTRGYGGKPPALPWPVKPGGNPLFSGDEAMMLAQSHPKSIVLVDPNRSIAAQWAISGVLPRKPDLFIMDDGFQHISTARDLNLVLLDKDDLPEGPGSNWNKILPQGTWREPVTALHAAHAFLIKCSREEWQDLQPALSRRLAPFSAPIFAFSLQTLGLSVPGKSKSLLQAEAIQGPYALVSAVGNPAQVRASVESFLGRPPEKELVYPDHFDFSGEASALAALKLPLVCTAKDAVKLGELDLPDLYVLKVLPDFHSQSGPPFCTWLNDWAEKHPLCICKS